MMVLARETERLAREPEIRAAIEAMLRDESNATVEGRLVAIRTGEIVCIQRVRP